jgi:NAD(P)-dependent dehydrogenase (short-subunit alcohol dehydrogenase family)
MGNGDLVDKRIVITGAGGRLGSRMVRKFSSAGGEVVGIVVSDEEAERVPQGSGAPVVVKRVDVLDEQSVIDCYKGIGDELGEIDALVHTIGMWSASPLLKTSAADWDLMLRVNLTSAFLSFREAVRIMNPAGGTLIGISSRQGADGGAAQQPAYSAAKAGVIRLLESVAGEYADARVSCHAIAPSTILFEEEGDGVQAADVIEVAGFLITKGRALTGATIRMYGE